MTEDLASEHPLSSITARVRRPTRRVGWVVAGAALVIGVAVAVTHAHRTEPAAPPAAPYSVANDRIDFKEGAPAWGYIELARAILSDPIGAEPVPGRVAFDEARSQPIIAPLQGHVDTV